MQDRTEDLLQQKQKEIEQLKRELKDASRPSALFATLKRSVKRGVREFFDREERMKGLDARVKELEKELEEANEGNAQAKAILLAAAQDRSADATQEKADSVESLMGTFPQTAEEALKKYFAPSDVENLLYAGKGKHGEEKAPEAERPGNEDPDRIVHAPEQNPEYGSIQVPAQEPEQESGQEFSQELGQGTVETLSQPTQEYPPDAYTQYAQTDGDGVQPEGPSTDETAAAGTGLPAGIPAEDTPGAEGGSLLQTEESKSFYQTENTSGVVDKAADEKNGQAPADPSVYNIPADAGDKDQIRDTQILTQEAQVQADGHTSRQNQQQNTVSNTVSQPDTKQPDKKRKRKRKKASSPDTGNSQDFGGNDTHGLADNEEQYGPLETAEISFGFAESGEITPPPIVQPWTVFSGDEFDDDCL